MRYKLFGNTGLRVSELALGGMTFGEEWGWGASEQESRAIFDAFLQAGGNFIDTAVNYTNGTSEKYLGKFMADMRDHIVLATKYTVNLRKGDPNAAGNHRKNMMQSLHRSLRQLNTDYIDIYWVHIWDYLTPVEEVMRALDDMVRAGKILYVGISDTPAWIVSRANLLAELRGWTPFAGLQIEYSLIERTPERELLPMARALGLAVTPWGVIGGGVLAGKYNQPTSEPKRIQAESGSRRLRERNLKIAAEVVNLAHEIGRSPSQVALNWLRQQPGTVIPILGARNQAQLKDNLSCLEFTLSPEHLDRLDAVSRIELGFPHEFASSPNIRDITFAGYYDLIDKRSK